VLLSLIKSFLSASAPPDFVRHCGCLPGDSDIKRHPQIDSSESKTEAGIAFF